MFISVGYISRCFTCFDRHTQNRGLVHVGDAISATGRAGACYCGHCCRFVIELAREHHAYTHKHAHTLTAGAPASPFPGVHLSTVGKLLQWNPDDVRAPSSLFQGDQGLSVFDFDNEADLQQAEALRDDGVPFVLRNFPVRSFFYRFCTCLPVLPICSDFFAERRA